MSRPRRRPATNRRQGVDRAALRKFWGEPFPDDPDPVRPSPDPTALVLSLGDPPLRGSEKAASATFTLVYQRASQLAILAATAAGLDADPED